MSTRPAGIAGRSARERAGTAARAPSLTDQAYARIKARILSGEIPAGALLDTPAMAAELGLGRTPVREALLRLKGDGVVEILPKRGARVVPLTAGDLRDLYEVISAIEVQAVARIAAQRPGRAALATLDEATREMADALARRDDAGWSAADERFHRALLGRCGNPHLAAAGNAYRDRAQRAHRVALRLTAWADRRRSIAAHRKLVAALAAGSVEDARALHGGQRAHGAQMLVSVLREHGLSWL